MNSTSSILINIAVSIMLLVPCMIHGTSWGKVIDLGVVGATYPVIEPDMLDEMQEMAAQIKMPSVEERKEALLNYRPRGLKNLPRATEERVFHPDFTYTLLFDIPQVDQAGNVIGILYPKGFTFNPLDYIQWDGVLVILNGEDEDQLNWFKASEYAEDYRTKLLITQGSWYDIEQDLQTAVFYADEILINKLNVSNVPAVVRQVGSIMEVREVLICDQE